jgi:DNA-binding winged helix-turn-helix (wHTH) protein
MRTAFGSVMLDTETRQLLRNHEPVPLSPKAFELLALLIENRPRALSKQELHERLWPGTYVTDTNLAGLIAEIRRAVQDDARTPRYVRTVHRFGYAFSGTVGTDPGVVNRQQAAVSRFWLTRGKKHIRLVEGENLLGREIDELAFDSATVSRCHARLTIAAPHAYLEDLGSKNGTFLRGRRIASKAALADGDTLQLGSVALVFHAPHGESSTRTWKPGRRS